MGKRGLKNKQTRFRSKSLAKVASGSRRLKGRGVKKPEALARLEALVKIECRNLSKARAVAQAFVTSLDSDLGEDPNKTEYADVVSVVCELISGTINNLGLSEHCATAYGKGIGQMTWSVGIGRGTRSSFET